ncbi:MAG TPA: Hsp20/alpha crystallin family protein [Solirubrobacteraceae bacterium]|nr:Hsp20/alpha crystallin family protein [Solirubrobacteraceae bacterium]
MVLTTYEHRTWRTTMALIRWEPAREMQTIQQEMNRLFGTFFDSQAGGNGDGATLRRWVPAMDLVEEGDRYVLRADLPGVREEDVKIELEDNVLTISGERRSEHEERKEGYYRVERASGSFSRSLVLPEGVDPQQIRARIEHGVLEVSVPKPAERKPHRVAIDVAGSATQVGAGQQDGDRAAAAQPEQSEQSQQRAQATA